MHSVRSKHSTIYSYSFDLRPLKHLRLGFLVFRGRNGSQMVCGSCQSRQTPIWRRHRLNICRTHEVNSFHRARGQRPPENPLRGRTGSDAGPTGGCSARAKWGWVSTCNLSPIRRLGHTPRAPPALGIARLILRSSDPPPPTLRTRPFRLKARPTRPHPTSLAPGHAPPRDLSWVPSAGRRPVHPRRSEVTRWAGLRGAGGRREDGCRGRILAPPPPVLEPAQMRRLGWVRRRLGTGAGGTLAVGPGPAICRRLG